MNCKKFYYILITLFLSSLIGCSEDIDTTISTIDDDSAPIAIGVRSEWVNGRQETGSRASYFDNVPPTNPEWIYVTCTEKAGEHVDNLQDFLVMKDKDPDIYDDIPIGYEDFHVIYLWDRENGTWKEQPKTIYKRKDAQKLRFKAYSFSGEKPGSPDEIKKYINDFDLQYDDGTFIRYFGTSDLMASDITEYTGNDDASNNEYKNHILFTLKHRSALLRLHFSASDKYLKIRDIVLRKVSINDEELTLTQTSHIDDGDGLQLTSSQQAFAYTFPNPSINIGTLEFKCVYDIYDKDQVSSEHRTRKGVVATNRVDLTQLLSSTSLDNGKLKAGYYYDFKITIDPDYLYVLSEHDNKMHLKIE